MSPQQIWQSQSEDAPRVPLEYVRRRTDDLARRSRGKVNRLFFGQLFMTAYMGWLLFTRFAGKPLMQFTMIASVVGVWFSIARWRRKTAPAPIDAAASVLDSLRYYRGELVRQRDAHRHNWREVLLSSAVMMPLLATAYIVEMHRSWTFVAVMFVFVFALVGLGTLNFARIRRQIQQEIDEVDLLAAG